MAKGFVYVLRNEAFSGLLKIGHSVKVPTERLSELFTTGVPEPFVLEYYCLVQNAERLESHIHSKLNDCRHRSNREFFRVELRTVVELISTLCTPEHIWYKSEPDPTSLGGALEPFEMGTSHKASCPGEAYGIEISSRHDDDREIQEMFSFAEAAHKEGLSAYVRGLFYDSNSCCCTFSFSEEVREGSAIAEELFKAASETIAQFEWFGRVAHGRFTQSFDEF